jgi:hypothetical protein
MTIAQAAAHEERSQVAVSLDHVGLNLPEESFPFWTDLLAWLGFEIRPDGSHFDAVGDVTICVTATKAAFSSAGYHRRQTGLSHLALRLASCEAVDAFVSGYLGPRGIAPLYGGAAQYDYSPGYYAVYFEDPARLKIEIMATGQAGPSPIDEA